MLTFTAADVSGVVGVSIAVYRVKIDAAGPVPSSPNSWRRTEPGLGLIKQVEQVTTFVWAGARQDSEYRDQRGGRGSGIFNLLNI
jgi:hypothetical protein